MNTKEQIINKLIEENGYTRYLEIGYQYGHCYNQIECEYKAAVDPAITEQRDDLFSMGSNQFFTCLFDGDIQTKEFDIVFIDGLHHADQVRKDIINASKCLSVNGAIVLHDLIPPTKEAQIVPRETKQWTGDVWRAMVGFRKKYPEVVAYTHNCDYGVGVIFPAGKVFTRRFVDKTTTYEDFVKNQEILLGIVRNK